MLTLLPGSNKNLSAFKVGYAWYLLSFRETTQWLTINQNLQKFFQKMTNLMRLYLDGISITACHKQDYNNAFFTCVTCKCGACLIVVYEDHLIHHCQDMRIYPSLFFDGNENSHYQCQNHLPNLKTWPPTILHIVNWMEHFQKDLSNRNIVSYWLILQLQYCKCWSVFYSQYGWSTLGILQPKFLPSFLINQSALVRPFR